MAKRLRLNVLCHMLPFLSIKEFNVSSRKTPQRKGVFQGVACLKDHLQCQKSIGVNNLSSNTMGTATKWMETLGNIVDTGKYWWHNPLINVIDSEIILEWWHDAKNSDGKNKKLTVYCFESSIDYIKVCGADIDNEMEEGMAETAAQIEALWRWLAS
jgi:hypothetical protein